MLEQRGYVFVDNKLLIEQKINRQFLPDFLRILAIFLMVFYHFHYDLITFQYLSFDIINHPFWWFLPRLIVFLFLFTSGLSLFLTHHLHIRWRKFFQRFIKLFLASLTVSVVTYYIYPERWIYFGTLHNLTLSSLLGLAFLKTPKLAFTCATALFTGSFLGHDLPWITLSHSAMDHVELFPYFGALLYGISFGHFSKNFHELCSEKRLGAQRLKSIEQFFTMNIARPIQTWTYWKNLQKLSEHSLLFYLLHQPILFALFFGISFFRSTH